MTLWPKKILNTGSKLESINKNEVLLCIEEIRKQSFKITIPANLKLHPLALEFDGNVQIVGNMALHFYVT